MRVYLFLLLFFICGSLSVQDLETDFRKSKNVIIAVSIGGSSHSKWVLEIGGILADRGHNVTFLTHDDQLKNSKHFKNIHTYSFGEHVFPDPKLVATAIQEMNFAQLNAYFKKNLNRVYPEELSYYKKHFFGSTDWKPDLFICDAFNDPCLDSALELKVPAAVTSTFILRQEFNTPYINNIGVAPHYTSEHLTLWQRIFLIYFETVRFFYYMFPENKKLDEFREQAGMPKLGLELFKTWDNSLKLVNSFDGFKPAHYLDTMTHVVGPIMSTQKANLSMAEQDYLDRHQRVAYVAFGQHAMSNKHDLEVLLGGILHLLETKLIDGVIWVRLAEQIKYVESIGDGFTQALTYKGVHLKALRDVLRLESIYSIAWAAQFSILQHKSTVLFVSHGGAESAHEAIYSGVPILVYPFYGDQGMNGQALAVAGVAFTNNRETATIDLVKKQMSQILRDEQGTFQRNITRMKALAQINSNRKYLAADLLEEHMFTSVDGIAIHRIEASKKMSWMKARNLDVHLLVLSVVSITTYAVTRLFKWIFSSTSNKIHL